MYEQSQYNGALSTGLMLHSDTERLHRVMAQSHLSLPFRGYVPRHDLGGHLWGMVLAHNEQQPQLLVTQRSQEGL